MQKGEALNKDSFLFWGGVVGGIMGNKLMYFKILRGVKWMVLKFKGVNNSLSPLKINEY